MNLHFLRKWFVRHTVLVRTVSFALVLISIPTMLLTYGLVHNAEANLKQSTQQHSQFITATAANQFSEAVIQMIRVAQQMRTDHALSDYQMAQNVAAELETIDALDQYMNALPFARDCCIYLKNSPDVLYTTGGKYDLNIYENLILRMPENSLKTLLSEVGRRATFCYCADASADTLFFVPIDTGAASNNRICIVTLSQESLLNYLSPIFSDDQHRLSAVFSADGEVVFYNSDSPVSVDDLARVALESEDGAGETADSAYLLFSAESSGYTAVVSTSSTSYAQGIMAFTASVNLVTFVNVFVCVVMALILVWMNYRPVYRMLNDLGIDPKAQTGTNEFESVVNAYANKEENLQVLEDDYLQRTRAFRKRLLLSLINGRVLSEKELELINHPENGSFAVCTTHLDSALLDIDPAFSSIRFEILPEEHENYLVLLCYVADRDELMQFCRVLVEALGQVRIGVSSICASMPLMHRMYLESILMLETADGLGCFFYAPDTSDGPDSVQTDLNLQLMQLARMLKNGDKGALEMADMLFESIRYQTSSFAYQTYSCFALVSGCQRILNKLGFQFTSQRAAEILNHNSITAIRDDFRNVLLEGLEQIRQLNSNEQAELSARMRAFVDARFTDPDFTLTTLADAFEQTEYAASRMFKDVFGLNFKRYITEKRIGLSKHLLTTTDDTVAEIAEASGFSSASYFTKVFKAEVDMTPAIYRSRTRTDESKPL